MIEEKNLKIIILISNSIFIAANFLQIDFLGKNSKFIF